MSWFHGAFQAKDWRTYSELRSSHQSLEPPKFYILCRKPLYYTNKKVFSLWTKLYNFMNISIQFMLIIDILFFQFCIIWKHDHWRFHLFQPFHFVRETPICGVQYPYLFARRKIHVEVNFNEKSCFNPTWTGEVEWFIPSSLSEFLLLTIFLCLFSNSTILCGFSLRFIKQVLAQYLGGIFCESQAVNPDHEL